jgi:hypothetical protein
VVIAMSGAAISCSVPVRPLLFRQVFRACALFADSCIPPPPFTGIYRAYFGGTIRRSRRGESWTPSPPAGRHARRNRDLERNHRPHPEELGAPRWAPSVSKDAPLARSRLWPSFETRASALLRTRLIDAAMIRTSKTQY